MLGFAYLMPDCWLEVTLPPEGPVTGQLGRGFPWISSIVEHFALYVSHSAFPVLILSSAHNKIHFLKLYSPSKALLPEGRAGTAREPSTER
jgi:hypothetical protein